MPAVETRYEHVVLDEHQIPTITGTTMKVIELVLDSQAHGWSPEELKLQHPDLSLGEIHSALAYTGTIERISTATSSKSSRQPIGCGISCDLHLSWNGSRPRV